MNIGLCVAVQDGVCDSGRYFFSSPHCSGDFDVCGSVAPATGIVSGAEDSESRGYDCGTRIGEVREIGRLLTGFVID